MQPQRTPKLRSNSLEAFFGSGSQPWDSRSKMVPGYCFLATRGCCPHHLLPPLHRGSPGSFTSRKDPRETQEGSGLVARRTPHIHQWGHPTTSIHLRDPPSGNMNLAEAIEDRDLQSHILALPTRVDFDGAKLSLFPNIFWGTLIHRRTLKPMLEVLQDTIGLPSRTSRICPISSLAFTCPWWTFQIGTHP